MVGREIDNVFPQRASAVSEDVVLEVRNWSAVDLRLGRAELARSIFGNPDHYRVTGELAIRGTVRSFHHPHEAIEDHVAYASEDRKAQGLILIQDVKQDITLANLREVARRGVVDATGYRAALNIKTPSLEQTGYIAVLAVGMTLVIVIRHMDLSVGFLSGSWAPLPR
jgi:putative multiple sugar transport system ATP-binding protein